MNEDDYDDYESCISDEEVDRYFAREINSINKADPTKYPCPSCDHLVLSAYQRAKGYICDSCADRKESGREY
jgi:ribosomal protein L37AE/L43A